MSITMQGAWTVQVKSKSAAFDQRFVIKGSLNADGTYAGETTPPVSVNVTGSQWTITIEHLPTGSTVWKRSAERLGTPVKSGGQIRCDILSNDTGGDKDYNDLILTCAMPESDSEFVIYGKLRSYSGRCGFNPCWPLPVLVIDTVAQLEDTLQHVHLAAAVQELYPERVKPFLARKVIRKPFPEPDPPPFRPMMIPLGEAAQGVQEIAARYAEDVPAGAAAVPLMMTAQREPRAVAASAALRDYAKLKDKYRLRCTVEDRPGMLLRFLEYDRTADELIGGPYTGEGDRQLLGYTVTDETGNYLFRFSRTLPELAEEFADVAAGETLVQALRPDIIVQVVAGTSAGTKPLFETALYSDIPNLKRINLCVPASAINPGPVSCQGGRAIQAIGNIFVLSGVGNTLYSSGRITATHPSGPKITRGAWAGRLDLYACFLDLPEVVRYTIRYSKPGGTWDFVQEQYTHIFIPAIGFPASPLHKVGPFDTSLRVDGGGPVTVPAYKNIENDPDWVATHRLRKVQLTSGSYAGLLYTAGAGRVDFRIEGYDAGGNKVAGADDTVPLYIDGRWIDANIDKVSLGAVSPGECALFEIPAPDSALTIRFKVRHPGGFLQQYRLTAMRGSATAVPLTEVSAPTTQPLALSYSEAAYGNYFYGTANAVSPDVDDYVVAVVQPTLGQWLPTGKNFCAFAFTLNGTRRITDGYNLDPEYWLDSELIGISYTAPSPAP